MLYKVFRDKVDLFISVRNARSPIAMLSEGLAEHTGRGSVQGVLRRLAAALLSFYLESIPIAAPVFSDPDLLTRHREALRERGAGRLSSERVAWRPHPDVAAELLVAAPACTARSCFTSRVRPPHRPRSGVSPQAW